MNGDCERARQWASIELDGELSTFERVLLRAHLAHCPPCREFSAETTGLTHALRAAPLEQLEQPIEIGRVRRGLRLRLAPAAAAMAMLFVGIGSILATSAVRSVGTNHTRTAPVTAELGGIEAMNLSTSTALEHLNAFQQIRVSTANRSLRGGPVLQER